MPIDNLSKITSRSGINTTILLEAGNANVTGIVTAAGFDGPFTGGSGSDINAGLVTARDGLHVGAGGTIIHAMSSSNGYVGINSTTPSYELVVSPTDTNESTLQIKAGGNGKESNVYFGAPDDDDVGKISYDHNGDHMKFVVGTVERFRISSSGNVGISSNNGTPQALLDIKNVGNSVLPLKVYRNDVGDTPIVHLLAYNNTLGTVDKLVVTSRGRVGVNTDDPQREIHIKPDSSTASAAPAYVRIESHGSDQPAELELYHTRGNGSDKWPSAVASADGALTLKVANGNNGAPQEKVRITSGGNVGINSTSPNAQFVLNRSLTENNAIEMGYSSSDGGLHFIQAYNRSTSVFTLLKLNNALSITSAGRVGINSSSPSNTLVVQESTDNNSSIQLFRASTGGDIASINWATNQGNQAKINYRGATPSGMQFYTGGGADSNLRMLIDPDGKVGIGTNEPSGALHTYITSATQRSYFQSSHGHSFIRTLAKSTDENSGLEFYSGTSNIANITGVGTGGLQFEVNGSERLRIASDGVVSLGTQNKSWHSAYKVLQVGAAAISGQVEGDGTTTQFTNNAYFDQTNVRWEYSGAASDQATRLAMADGKFIFSTASAGTADNALTWVETFRITEGGDLRLGLNSVANVTDSAHYIMTLTGKSGQTGAGAIAFRDPSANTDGFIFADDGNLFITADYSNATADSSIRFRVDGSGERVRINSESKIIINNPDTSLGQDQLIGGLEWKKNDASGSGIGTAGGLKVYSDDSYGARSYMTFSVRQNSDDSSINDDTEFVRLTSGGRLRVRCEDMSSDPGNSNRGVLIGDTSSGCVFSNGSSTGFSNNLIFMNGNGVVGKIETSGSTTNYNDGTSDRTLKKNFENWTEEVLPNFKNLNPQKFNFLPEDDSVEKTKGFIAQDLAEHFPRAYPLDPLTDKYMFNPSGMVPYLMKALQEEIVKREALEARISALEGS